MIHRCRNRWVARPGASRCSILLHRLKLLGPLDEYRVTQVLGMGSMGVVFKAFEPQLKRWVAIKILAPSLASDLVARQRFARGAIGGAGLPSQHYYHSRRQRVQRYSLFRDGIRGGRIITGLARRQWRASWQAVARLGVEIAEGLAAAHSFGLIHRDIKPSNILLQRARRLDGFERFQDQRFRTGLRGGRFPIDPHGPSGRHAHVHGARASSGR